MDPTVQMLPHTGTLQMTAVMMQSLYRIGPHLRSGFAAVHQHRIRLHRHMLLQARPDLQHIHFIPVSGAGNSAREGCCMIDSRSEPSPAEQQEVLRR